MESVEQELPTGEVVGRFVVDIQDGPDLDKKPELVPATGTITFRAAIPYLQIIGSVVGDFTMFRGPFVAVLDDEGFVSTKNPDSPDEIMYRGMTLLANDSDLIPTKGWTWTATFDLKDHYGRQLSYPQTTFTVATGQIIDLTRVLKVPASPGVGIPQLEAALMGLPSRMDAVESKNTEQDQAISAAATDATTKANTAKSESIADATTKYGGLPDRLSAVEADMPWRGVLPNGTDINAVRLRGIYTVANTSAAGTMVNWPTNRAGILKVWTNDGASATTQEITAYVSTTAPTERYSRGSLSSANTNWSPWTPDTWNQGVLPTGTDLQKFRSPGAFQITSTGNSQTMLDVPTEDDGTTRVDGPGTLEIIPGNGTARALGRLTIEHNGKMREFTRSTGLVSSWPAWQEIGAAAEPTPAPSPEQVPSDPVSDHASRVEYARSRRGGGTGVLGKAVVMIRFDHWLVKFRDVILPIMREFDLVGTLNVNYDNIDNVQNGGGSITWGHVQDWNQYDGIEIANHGSTHTNASTRESIFHEVVDGRRNLEAAMPRVAVETWQEHGSAYLTASDIDGDIGLNLGREPKNFFESYAGKLVLAEHAIIEGKCGGFFTNLTGHPQIGQSHMSIDRSTAAQAIGQVETAKQFQRGVTLYVHPGLMDTVLVGGKAWDVTYNPDGSVVVTDPATSNTTPFADEAAYQSWADTNGHLIYMRTSHFRELCAYLSAERDAGSLLVMTAAGGGFADKSHTRRENLLVNPGFETTSTSWWAGTSSWTITNPGESVVVKAPTATGTLSQGMLMHSRFGWAMGATHELVVKARSDSAASLTLRMEKLGDPTTWQIEKVHTIPGDSTVRNYRLNLTLPRDPSITQMSIKISGDNGLEIVGQPLLAAI